MTRRTGFYNKNVFSIIIMSVIILASPSIIASSSDASDNSALMKLITQNEDPRMGVEDLAFFLVTHDFYAVPKKKGPCRSKIDSTPYVLVPNGQSPGLANVTAASLK